MDKSTYGRSQPGRDILMPPPASSPLPIQSHNPSDHFIGRSRSRGARVIEIVAVAAIYTLAGRAGLKLDAVSGFATLVWPGSGIALAALMLLGYRLWPAIAIGALATNLWAGAPVPAAIGIAIGNTLEAVVAAYALNRVPGFNTYLNRVRDVFALLIFAAVLSPIVSATIGVASLSFAGVVPGPAVAETWRAWWMGDFIGDLLVAPLIFVWVPGLRRKPRPSRMLESTALGLAVVFAGILVLGAPGSSDIGKLDAAYVFYPLLIWASLRFGPRGSVTTVFLVSTVAVWATISGHGPFVHQTLYHSLLALQTFIGVAAATFLILGGTIGELRRAERTAAAANRAKSDFLAVISHELRTPLNAISGYVELMQLNVNGPLTEKQRESLDRIQRNERHLLALIDDILGFARVEAGRLTLDIRHVNVAEAVSEVEPLIQPEVQKKKLEFSSARVDPMLTVRADPERLRQVLLNILSNAVKFTPEAGRISVGAEASPGKRIRFFVTDTGIGIPKEDLDRIFEPFVQADYGRTRPYPGVGLGLAIVRDLVTAMEGEIQIESKVGDGTTVSVLLPAV